MNNYKMLNSKTISQRRQKTKMSLEMFIHGSSLRVKQSLAMYTVLWTFYYGWGNQRETDIPAKEPVLTLKGTVWVSFFPHNNCHVLHITCYIFV